jgi:hypothetical protein
VASAREYRRTALVLAGLGLLFAVVAACGSAKNGATGVETPSSVWPQPVGGKLTKDMCGLLTDADYAVYHRTRFSLESAETDPANTVFCSYLLDDELTLSVQPTARAAKMIMENQLSLQVPRLGANGLSSIIDYAYVPGADDTWFDLTATSTPAHKEYHLETRRGALLVILNLGGKPDDSATDPKITLAGLATLVLQRLPGLGTPDPGQTHEITMQVSGTGAGATINYVNPSEFNGIFDATPSKLPWSTELPFAVLSSKDTISLRLTAKLSGGASAVLSCQISVDGKVEVSNSGTGTVLCQKLYHVSTN